MNYKSENYFYIQGDVIYVDGHAKEMFYVDEAREYAHALLAKAVELEKQRTEALEAEALRLVKDIHESAGMCLHEGEAFEILKAVRKMGWEKAGV